MRRVRAEREARLVVLGRNGGERPRIEALIQEMGLDADVDLVGHRANPFAYFVRADCYALSSIEEGMPNSLVEGLACGCPAVSTDCPSGPAEILEQGRYGPLVAVGDDRALAEGLLSTLTSPPARDRLRTRGRIFSRKHTVQRYIQVLETAGRRGEDPAGRALP